MKGWRVAHAVVLMFLVLGTGAFSFGENGAAPLEFLQQQERSHKDEQGMIYLGMVMEVNFFQGPGSLSDRERGFLLELTDVLKSPIRGGYRLVLKGCEPGMTDGGRSEADESSEGMRKMLVQTYGLEESRITTGGRCQGPSGHVEVHVYGEISRAVRFMAGGEGDR